MDFSKTDFLFGANAPFVEELYELYLLNPSNVDPTWRVFFQNFHDHSKLKTATKIIMPAPQVVKEKPQNKSNSLNSIENTLRAKFLIWAYRQRGHLMANLDPLGLEEIKTKHELNLNIEDFGFSQDQLNEKIEIAGEFSGISSIELKDLVALVDKTYAGSIGVEFNHVENGAEREWLFDQIENAHIYSNFSDSDKKNILNDLMHVDSFEQYLHTKFPGAKRFSIEGGDVFISALKQIIQISASFSVEDVVIGMAHRGRLNTLVNVMDKPYRAIFYEFMGNSAFPKELDVSGDVKYHMGYSTDVSISDNRKVHLSLSPNPSHLEAVNPVVSGRVRAKQDFINDKERKKILGILVHGDAAFCGQGIVAENLVMSGLEAYKVGGIIHFVINNQVGFTANAKDTRPGRYATEVAKIVGAPVLHINGDDVEAVLIAVNLAANYRQKFGKDIVIDIVCYRKYGHNEGDEPMYTQAVMYNIIKNKQSPANIYANKLLNEGIIDSKYFGNIRDAFKAKLDEEYNLAKDYKPEAQWLEGMWAGYIRDNSEIVVTGCKKNILQEIGLKLCTIPSTFALNPKLAKLFENRAETLREDKDIDWASAEQLAFATILEENYPIRLTGQDCGRGTFSHRHSVLHSQADDSIYEPLNNISEKQANYFVADSNLSEYGVLGFEYGYSLVNPRQLVIWEAQFGDFANGAQIIFDQFISSAETKWLRMSGLVMLLPHGFEGQGPEHSSARLERFLQFAAEDNLQITYPTNPASIFHLLRRQIYTKVKKPLIIMSPKSLLRHKLAISKLDDLAEGTYFKAILDEIDNNIKPDSVEKLIICSGKVYYDLLEKRIESKVSNIAIIRLEQLYPFVEKLAIEIFSKYSKAKEFVFCQEEPKNMGAWNFIQEYLNKTLEKMNVKNRFLYVGRDSSASPAAGSLYVHNKEQDKLVNEALNLGA